MRKPLKHFLVVATVLGILALVANVLVDNPYTHRLIRTALNRSMQAETNLVIDFKAIKVSVVPTGFDLYGLEIAPRTESQAPLFSAAQVKVRLSLWALVLGDIRLGLVEAQEPTVVWPPPWNFPGFLKNPTHAATTKDADLLWPPTFPFPIDRIVIKKGRIALSLPLEEEIPRPMPMLSTTLEGVDLDFSWRSWQKMNAEIEIKTANLGIDHRSILEDTSLEASLSLRGIDITLDQLKTRGQRLNIDDGRGKIRIETSPNKQLIQRLLIETAIKVDGDLSLLGTFLDLPDTYGRIKGETHAQIKIPLTGTEPVQFQVKGEAEAQDARLDDYRLYNSRVRFEVTPDQVAFPDIEVVVGTTRYAKGRGILHLDETLSFEWYVKPEKLRLLDLLDSLGVPFDQLDGALLAEDLKIIGKGDPFEMKVSAHAQFSDLILPHAPYNHRNYTVPPQCRFDLHLDIDENRLSLDGTTGLCFQTKELVTPSMPTGPIQAPRDALGASPVTVQGDVHFTRGIQLLIQSPALDLSLGEYFATIPVTGKAKATTHIRGPFESVQILSRIDAQDVHLMGMPLGHVQGETLVTAEEVLWKDVRITPGDSAESLRTDGSLDLGEALNLKAHIKARNIQHEHIYSALREAFPGKELGFGINLFECDLAGPLLSPLAMEGQITMDVSKVTQGAELLADHAHVKVKARSSGIVAEDLQVDLGTLHLGGRFRHQRINPLSLAEMDSPHLLQSLGIHPDDRMEAAIWTISQKASAQVKNTEQDLASDHLSHLPYVRDAFAKANIQGLINLKAKISGHFKSDIQGTFEGGITQAGLLGSRLAPIAVNGFIKNTRLDLTFNHSGNSLEGRMSLDLGGKDIPFEWYLNMHRLDLRAIGSPLFYADPRNYLYVTGDWHLKGHFGQFWQSTGELDIKGIRAKYVRDLAAQTKTIMIAQEKPVKLRFTPQCWCFDGDQALRLSGRHINVAVATGKDSVPSQLDIKLDSTIDMAMARDISQEVDIAEGQLLVKALVNGPINEPSLKFNISDQKPSPFTAGSWRPVTFGLTSIRPAMRNIKFSANYAKGRLTIHNLLADKGTGTVSATGSIGLTEEAEEGSRLDVTLSDATLVYTVAFLRSFETQVSGNLSLSGRGIPYKLSGGVNITKARSTKEVDIRDEIINVLRQKSFSAQIIQEKPTLVFDLKISADQTINIHNRNLQAILSTNLSLQGTDIAPELLGQVDVNKGRFIYKRDFQIQRGLVIFDNPVRPDPNLDILAVSEVDTYRAYITISGRASNPTVEFSIDPPTRESGAPISKLEILVLLSRGKLPEENRSLGQETQSAAASEAANLILGQFEEPVEKLFDLSGQNVVRNVYIDTYPSPDGGPVPRLNLPLDIGEDFDVVLRADGQTNEVSTVYTIHDNINFSGALERRRADEKALQSRQVGPDFEAKVNLKFRFSFD